MGHLCLQVNSEVLAVQRGADPFSALAWACCDKWHLGFLSYLHSAAERGGFEALLPNKNHFFSDRPAKSLMSFTVSSLSPINNWTPKRPKLRSFS